MFLQLVVSGLAAGGIYALLALALVVVYKSSSVLNFAQGEMAMVSAFVAFSLLTRWHVPLTVVLPLILLFGAALGFLVERVLLRPLEAGDALPIVVVTIGANLVLHNTAGWLWGVDYKDFPQFLPIRPLVLSGLVVSQQHLLVMAIVVALALALGVFFKTTRVGMAMRAAAQDPEAARLQGVGPGVTIAASWAISGALGGLSAVLVAPIVNLYPDMMEDVLVFGFAAAILGGLTSLPGAVIGGFVIGVLENLAGVYLGSEWKGVLAFVVIVALLCLRPAGLLGEAEPAP